MSEIPIPEFPVFDAAHCEALELIAPMVARFQRAAGPHERLVLGGPAIDAIRTRTPLAKDARLFVLTREPMAASRVRNVARSERIGGREPIIFNCAKFANGPRQASITSHKIAYTAPMQVNLVGYDPFNRRTITLPGVYLVADVPAITMALAKVDDDCSQLDAWSSGKPHSRDDVTRVEQSVDASLRHAVKLLDAIGDRAITVDLEAIALERQPFIADLLDEYINGDDTRIVAADANARQRALMISERVHTTISELGPPTPGLGFWVRMLVNSPTLKDQLTQLRRELTIDDAMATRDRSRPRPIPGRPGRTVEESPQVTTPPVPAPGKGLANVISLDDVRAAKASRARDPEGLIR